MKSELKKLAENLQISMFKDEKLLDCRLINDSVIAATSKYLRHARTISSKLLNRAIEAKDERTQNLEVGLQGHNNLVALKEKYYNSELADQVLNKNEPDKIVEIKGRLYRKYEPVFNIQESKFGRAQFFAPYKILGNFIFDTFWFDFIVIWIMSIIFYFTLLYDVLGRIIKKFMNRLEMWNF